MLKFREIDYDTDVPEIVNLLRTSLSETNDLEHFYWKHCKNPFGLSYGLLAQDKDKIVGVRMFMFWEFEKEGKIFKAIRPVDTITHGDYRGKGIFKTLTLQGLENCKGKYDFVFNTPNSNSLPGYLKMGWHKETQDLKFYLGFLLPFWKSKTKVSFKRISSEDLQLPMTQKDCTSLRTNITKAFIEWRYAASVYQIMAFKFKDDFGYVIYREMKLRGLKTLILIDYIGSNTHFNLVIRNLASFLKIIAIYYLKNNLAPLETLFSVKRGSSDVVYRDDPALITSEIVFSAGDLEGRL